MASPQAEYAKATLAEMRQATLEGTPTLEQLRAGGDMMGAGTAEPEGVTVTETTVAGRPAEWIVPDGAATDRVLLYVHGGGYVICSMRTHTKLVGHLAKAIGCRALNIEYRLAPEHPHPAAVTDAVGAYKAILDMGIEPAHLMVAGDSAGGGLTVATLLKAKDDGLPRCAGAVAISPWVDMEGLGSTITTKADADLLVNGDALKMMAEYFLQGHDARDPYASPLYGDLRGIAPLLIQVGGDETLLDDAVRLAGAAGAAGVDVTLEVFPEMQHVFQAFAGVVPEADDAIARIGAWARPRLGLA